MEKLKRKLNWNNKIIKYNNKIKNNKKILINRIESLMDKTNYNIPQNKKE